MDNDFKRGDRVMIVNAYPWDGVCGTVLGTGNDGRPVILPDRDSRYTFGNALIIDINPWYIEDDAGGWAASKLVRITAGKPIKPVEEEKPVIDTSDIPEWAIKRACEIINEDGSCYDANSLLKPVMGTSMGEAFARYIASKEDAPVDPLVLEAREIVFADHVSAGNSNHDRDALDAGALDNEQPVRLALRALRRGIEIGEGE